MIGQKNAKVFWHQSEARTGLTVWNWSVKTLSPGALLRVLDFSSAEIFFARFRLFPVPTNCPWLSEDVVMTSRALISKIHCTLSANQKRVRESNVYIRPWRFQSFSSTCLLNAELRLAEVKLLVNTCQLRQ